MTTQLRTLAEIKAEVDHLKAMKQMRADAATVVANGDVDTAALRLFVVRYGREYDWSDFTDAEQRCDLENCRSLVRNPLLLYEREFPDFARIVAELAAPGPERDARVAERAIAARQASPIFPKERLSRETSKLRCVPEPSDDPWAEHDGFRWELGPYESFQPDPEDRQERIDDGSEWEEQERCRIGGGR